MLVREELHDPRVAGLVTITQIDTSPDLRHAIAFVSVLGTEEERASTMRALQHAETIRAQNLAAAGPEADAQRRILFNQRAR